MGQDVPSADWRKKTRQPLDAERVSQSFARRQLSPKWKPNRLPTFTREKLLRRRRAWLTREEFPQHMILWEE